MVITWDEKKNFSNKKKHKLSFEAAQYVFDDPLHLTRLERFENDEYRWQTIGSVDGIALVLVAHTVSDNDEQIRIISARRATKKERRIYEQHSWIHT